jgi:hypothetical protein
MFTNLAIVWGPHIVVFMGIIHQPITNMTTILWSQQPNMTTLAPAKIGPRTKWRSLKVLKSLNLLSGSSHKF